MSGNSPYIFPATAKEMKELGWNLADVILFTGDAFVDHPSFGTAIIARVLESEGYKVAVVPQPNWQDDLRDFKKMGKPGLFFGVTAGNMDSMVNHYTALKRLRHDDAYTPGGRHGARPDYATTVYTKILKQLFPDIPVVIGGIEASMRRLTHYDYWSDRLFPSILADSGADLLIYGMGETSVKEIARQLNEGIPAANLTGIPQTAFLSAGKPDIKDCITLHSHEDCLKSKEKFAANFRLIENESNRLKQKTLIQAFGKKYIVVNPAFPPLSTEELDRIYDLPYTRVPHPKYRGKPPIPAWEMIRHSMTIHRGCFGGCSFCTISAHQGKFVSSRSEKSVLKETEAITGMKDFRGHITDAGGPSANMYMMQGKDMEQCQKCCRPSCIFPDICKNLGISHDFLNRLYDKISANGKVKKLTIGSGIRYDLLYHDNSDQKTMQAAKTYFRKLVQKHVSGRLKVAPEHSSSTVLDIMRKPSFSLYRKLHADFAKINRENGLNQQLVPYFISSHPGCTIEEMAQLAIETKDMNHYPDQVQDFTPTPMTLSTVIYYTGIHPYTGKKVQVARPVAEKQLQNKFFFWQQADNRKLISDALNKRGRHDLTLKLFDSGKKRKF
ncbi:MAG: YgiQ family radical SAM protein [Bacteroidota bacterium]